MKLQCCLISALSLGLNGLGAWAARFLEGDLKLRVCNAVPSPGHSLQLSMSFLGNDQTLQYRECNEYSIGHPESLSVNFKLGNGAQAKWPQNAFDCVDCHTVFLIAYRRVQAVGLEVDQFDVKYAKTPDSHPVSQVFFLDAYEGGGISPSLSLHPSFETAVRGSVASIGLEPRSHEVLRPGRYEATVDGGRMAKTAQSTLIVAKGECYVVVRVGMAGRQDGLPSELVVFPKSDSSLLPKDERAIAPHPSWSAIPMVLTLFSIF